MNQAKGQGEIELNKTRWKNQGRWVTSENGTGWSHFLVAGQVLWVTWNLHKNKGRCGEEKHRNKGL